MLARLYPVPQTNTSESQSSVISTCNKPHPSGVSGCQKSAKNNFPIFEKDTSSAAHGQLSSFIGAIISYTIWSTCLVCRRGCHYTNFLLIWLLLDHLLLPVSPLVPSVLLLFPSSDMFCSWTITQTISDNFKCDKWLCLSHFISLSPCLSLLLDVYPNHHPDHLSQPVCLCLSGDALHAQGLRHPLPPRAERPQTKTQLQGEVDMSLVCYIYIIFNILHRNRLHFKFQSVIPLL